MIWLVVFSPKSLDIYFTEKDMGRPRTYKKSKQDEDTAKLVSKVDIEFVNQMIGKSEEMGDFKISKSTLANISSWALNGESDKEIREHLDLTDHQFAILCTVCPTLLLIMDRSRAMADLIVAGSLFQTAIGGKRIKKQQAVKVGIYENGVKTGERIEKVWLEEELPPRPELLKFLAENKLSQNFGEHKGVDESKMKELADSLTERDRALIEQMSKKMSDVNGNN